MELIKKLLADKGPELVQTLVARAGFSEGEANDFLPAVLGKLGDLFGRGELDLTEGASKLAERINPGALGLQIGLDEEKASSGLAAIVPDLLEGLKGMAGTGGIAGLLGSSDGGTDGLNDLAGKLFGR